MPLEHMQELKKRYEDDLVELMGSQKNSSKYYAKVLRLMADEIDKIDEIKDKLDQLEEDMKSYLEMHEDDICDECKENDKCH